MDPDSDFTDVKSYLLIVLQTDIMGLTAQFVDNSSSVPGVILNLKLTVTPLVITKIYNYDDVLIGYTSEKLALTDKLPNSFLSHDG